MKKIIIILCLFICICNVKAIESIKIDNNDLVPKFNKDTHVYNYFTYSDEIIINTKGKENEIIINDGKYKLTDNKTKIIITSSNNEEYIINIFKNYDKDTNEEVYLEDLTIEGYDIEFNRDCYLYSVNLHDEEYLNIKYELSNQNAYVSVSGNGNFNSTDNIIKINVNNEKEYIIHAYKSISVSKIQEDNIIEEMSDTKKEIVKIVIITISCSLVFLLYYTLFVNKSFLHI